jgi:hypothetical protein
LENGKDKTIADTSRIIRIPKNMGEFVSERRK